MIIAVMLSVAGLGFLCWLAFNLAVYALPFFAAVAGGLFAYHTGAGPIGGAAIAMAAGATTLVAGQFAFAHSRSTILRTMIAAAVAGYHLVLGVSTMGMASDQWRDVFAIIGAIVVGSTAWARFSGPRSRQPSVLRVRSAAGLRPRRPSLGHASFRHREAAAGRGVASVVVPDRWISIGWWGGGPDVRHADRPGRSAGGPGQAGSAALACPGKSLPIPRRPSFRGRAAANSSFILRVRSRPYGS
jgi:MFS family permease